jgi:hypothetical protein
MTEYITPPRSDCPIVAGQIKITDLSREMVKAIRQLRRDLAACQRCPFQDDCQVLRSFNAHVQSAIDEITEEWNLAAALS